MLICVLVNSFACVREYNVSNFNGPIPTFEVVDLILRLNISIRYDIRLLVAMHLSVCAHTHSHNYTLTKSHTYSCIHIHSIKILEYIDNQRYTFTHIHKYTHSYFDLHPSPLFSYTHFIIA